MAVGVQGHGYRGVTEKLLPELGMNTAAQQQGCAGVPEVVETYLRQSSSPKKKFQGPVRLTGVPTCVAKIRP